MYHNKVLIFTDGGARGNPGPAAVGAVIYDETKTIIEKYSKYIGERTNNQAEYEAVVLGLKEAKKMGAREVDLYLDSELVVNQLLQKFKVKNKELEPLFVKAWNLSNEFKKVNYFHVTRERNKEADRLVNQVLDQEEKQG